MNDYFLGKKLYGDDFSIDEIQKWFMDEAEGYSNLGAINKETYSYGYHALNRRHAFRFLGDRHFRDALGMGSAYGDEFKPIADKISRITILDPSDAFSSTQEILGTPCVYRKPNISGDIEFPSNTFDLIMSLGVMHHIPNVSHVLKECNRCLTEGGIMLLREPITSMGDWRQPRKGLTLRERGIPLPLMDNIIKESGFKTVRRTLCNFPAIPKVTTKIGIFPYKSSSLTAIDHLLSALFSWNITYHRTNFFKKLAPASIYYILSK